MKEKYEYMQSNEADTQKPSMIIKRLLPMIELQ